MDSIGLVYPTIYEIWPGLWARWDVPAASVRLTRSPYRLRSPNCFATETQVVRKNRSAGVSPASEPRQLLLGQHDLCRLEAGDTFFLTTTETRRTRIPGLRVSVAPWPAPLLAVARGI